VEPAAVEQELLRLLHLLLVVQVVYQALLIHCLLPYQQQVVDLVVDRHLQEALVDLAAAQLATVLVLEQVLRDKVIPEQMEHLA
jgi:hypothetical protein